MRRILVGKVKKWMIFALIGCFAYFAGYIWAQLKMNPSEPAEIPSIQEKVSDK